LLTPKAEKEFVRGVTDYMQGRFEEALAALRSVEVRDAGAAHIGEEFFAALSLVALGRVSEAIPYFEAVLASDLAIPDTIMSKYGIGGATEVGVTPTVSVTIPMSNLAVALMLAEAYQRTGQQRKAIELLESLGAEAPDASVFALSLADLYAEAERWGDVIRVTEAVETNENDITLNVLTFRALALLELDVTDGAIALTKECLRFRKRDPALLRFARYVKGLAYERSGKPGMAKREFEKIYAEDANFADVADRLGRQVVREPSPPPRPDL
jgi:tetratricopeptide (TPR) repeat protein